MGKVHYLTSDKARNEWGNTNDDPQLCRCIEQLEEQGVSPAEIEALIPDLLKAKLARLPKPEGQAEEHQDSLTIEDSRDLDVKPKEELKILAEMMERIVVQNNEVLREYICTGVSDRVVKDMEFLLQAKERSEEERFRNLDHLIRQQQFIRKEAAKATPVKKLLRFLIE